MDTLKVTIEVKAEMIASLLCSAFEGGSNYWYVITGQTEPPILTTRMDADTVFPHIDYPMNDGGSLAIRTLESDKIHGRSIWTLDQQALSRGLQTVADKYPDHLASILKDNTDATTGDVFLQCCIFGELIFG